MKPFMLSLVAGFVLSASVVGGFVWLSMSTRSAAVTRGWALRPVLRMAKDLNEGESLTAEALVEAQLPEQFVTGSTIDVGDRSRLIGKKPALPLLAGDVLVWGVFAERAPPELTTECLERIRANVNEAGVRASAAAVDAFEKRLGPPLPPPELPALSTGRESVEVVVAVEDLTEGMDLSSRQFTVRRLPQAFVTHSHVPGRFLEEVARARLVVPVQKGDPMLWQFLDDREAPRSAAACIDEAVVARNAARERVGLDEATAFLRTKGAP